MKEITPIWRYTKRQFIGGGRAEPVMASDSFVERFEADAAENFWPLFEDAATHAKHDGVDMAPSRVQGFTVAAFLYKGFRPTILFWAPDGKLAGGQMKFNSYILPEYRGLGVGREICRVGAEVGYLDVEMPAFFSRAGLGSRVAAHREAVRDAVSAGFSVPEEVLADYPDLPTSALTFERAVYNRVEPQVESSRMSF